MLIIFWDGFVPVDTTHIIHTSNAFFQESSLYAADQHLQLMASSQYNMK